MESHDTTLMVELEPCMIHEISIIQDVIAKKGFKGSRKKENMKLRPNNKT